MHPGMRHGCPARILKVTIGSRELGICALPGCVIETPRELKVDFQFPSTPFTLHIRRSLSLQGQGGWMAGTTASHLLIPHYTTRTGTRSHANQTSTAQDN